MRTTDGLTVSAALLLAGSLGSCGDDDEGGCAPGFMLVGDRLCAPVGDGPDAGGGEGEGEEGEGEGEGGGEGEGDGTNQRTPTPPRR